MGLLYLWRWLTVQLYSLGTEVCYDLLIRDETGSSA